MQHLLNLPASLPVPVDDGACARLSGMALPHCSLRSTQGGWIDLADQQGWLVVYCYPMTGRPDRALPQGWDEIPGARGCTPQACAFRDHHQELQQLRARVFGLSTQNSNYQLEAATRLHLPFALLSDKQAGLSSVLVMSRCVFAIAGAARVVSRRDHPAAGCDDGCGNDQRDQYFHAFSP
jgi:peroxiredoxin